MSEWSSWVFDGIGTEIIAAIIGLLIGGVGGFAVGKHITSKQMQKAGDYSKQKQTITVGNVVEEKSKRTQETNSIFQKQTAGNNSEQIQTGCVKHEQ